MLSYSFIFSTGSGKKLSEADIDFELVKKFLRGIESQLLNQQDDKKPVFYYERLNLVTHVGDASDGGKMVPVFVPKNVALRDCAIIIWRGGF